MKYILIVFVITAASCNHKKAIVEREKEVKQALNDIKYQEDFLEYDRQKLFNKYKSVGFTSTAFLTEAKTLHDSSNALHTKKFLLQSTLDSLEMELKKY